MNAKLIFKVSFLVFCLVLVFLAIKTSKSNTFQDGLNQIFTTDVKIMKWCPDHVVDFNWLEKNFSKKFVDQWVLATPSKIESRFCRIPLESTEVANFDAIKFKPLLQAQSAEAKTAILEWSPESKLFRVQGITFKSTSLSRELLDETK